MKTFSTFLVIAACMAIPANAWSDETRFLLVAVELQMKLLSLELPASSTDRDRVGDTMESFAHRYAFHAAGGPSSPVWDIQRFYTGPGDTSVVLSFFPEHTFVGLSKRPGDGDAHQDLVDALRASFAPLGFKPWVEPAE